MSIKGDALKLRVADKSYRDGYDAIFKPKKICTVCEHKEDDTETLCTVCGGKLEEAKSNKIS